MGQEVSIGSKRMDLEQIFNLPLCFLTKQKQQMMVSDDKLGPMDSSVS